MQILFQKNKGGYDHSHPMNNTTIVCSKQKFGRTKFNQIMQENYLSFLHDVEFICTAFRNPRNQPKDMPALIKLVELLKRKYHYQIDGAYKDVLQFHINSLEDELKDMTVKFYKYYFHEVEKPVIIEAITKQVANHTLESLMPELQANGYKLQNLADVRVETPIVGVSRKKNDGKNFVWTAEGWIEYKEGDI